MIPLESIPMLFDVMWRSFLEYVQVKLHCWWKSEPAVMQKIKRAAVAQVQCFNSVVQRCTVVHSVETVLKQCCTRAEEGGISDVKDQMEKKSAKRGGRAALLDHGILSASSGTHAPLLCCWSSKETRQYIQAVVLFYTFKAVMWPALLVWANFKMP